MSFVPLPKLRVLFVCMGNICRSPLAEMLFRHYVEALGLEGRVRCDSAGTGNWHVGEPPCEGTLATARRLGLRWEGVRARQIGPQDFAEFDYILAMDRENLIALERLLRAYRVRPRGKIDLLLAYAPHVGAEEVPDPYFDGRHEEVYVYVDEGVRGFLRHLLAERPHELGLRPEEARDVLHRLEALRTGP
ncbi:MAG: Low molecular weight protein tyrosine phosphatase [Brockia lithotrophica]|uniref:protein-tyrosine-phosphatase n=1 Tax=Brockia lithotrophica TaxID=933949 RepID=A0A2T5G9A3_9BACL|nr:MAG: Low molecular weight protein tyrosine phosphatase [Brockia lithotrophica]